MPLNTNRSDFNTYWAAFFLYSLQQQGVQRIFISPGSRSTPLTIAATLLPDVENLVFLDERSSGYAALGAAKYDGIPSLLICTSGTAAANYHPAVAESRNAGVPMIVCSADRPPELRDTGANQTMDQIQLFGHHPIWFYEVGEPNRSQKALDRLKTLASQAYHYSSDRRGPVHLNFPFAKPLEPSSEFLDELKTIIQSGFDGSTGSWVSQPNYEGTASPVISLPSPLKRAITDSRKPLIIAGPEQPYAQRTSAVYNLAQRLRAPIIAEAGSQIPLQENSLTPDPLLIHGYEQYLRDHSFLEDYQPDLVIRFYGTPTSNAINQALEYWQSTPEIHFDTHPDWHDPNHTVDLRIACRPEELRESLLQPLFNNCLGSEKWIESWRTTSQSFIETRDQRLEKYRSGNLTDGVCIHDIFSHIPKDLNLFLGNSLPVRDVEITASDQINACKQIVTQRGVSGIDGITSAAIGYTISSKSPGLLITGDLSFLHDTNALLNAELLNHPLHLVIINNGGGSIFRMLPISDTDSSLFEDFFETPQQVDIGKLVSSYSAVTYQLVSSLDELKSLFEKGSDNPGIHIYECRTDPETSVNLRKELQS